jgi:predicted nucleotidyltransferase
MKAKEEKYTHIIDIIQAYFKTKHYAFVLLFGSYANHTFSEQSDIDLGIYFNGKIDYMALGYDTAELESLLGKKVDVVALNDIYKKDSLFAFNILENHTVMLLNDEKKYINFKTSTQLYYLDRKELIEMNRKALKKRIETNTIGERNFA